MSLIEHASLRYNGNELYIEADEDELYDFLYTILPLLDEQVELFLTSDVRDYIVENEPMPSTSVAIESSSNLLEIGFNIEGVDDSEINQILNAVIEKDRKSTRLNSSHVAISYAVFCLKKKRKNNNNK